MSDANARAAAAPATRSRTIAFAMTIERKHAKRLFERGPRAVTLTAAGAALLPHARAALGAAAAGSAALAGLRGVLTGTLRLGIIGATETVQRELDDTLAAFHAAHPAVEIVIGDSGSMRMAEQVRNGELDVAFVGLFAEQVGDGLVHRLMASEPLVGIVGPEHPLASRRRVGLPELAESSPAVELRPESGLRVQVDAAYARAGMRRTVAFELSALGDVVRLVRLGLGVAVVPASSVAEGSGVVALALDDERAAHPVSLVHRSPAPASPAARAFLEALDVRRRASSGA